MFSRRQFPIQFFERPAGDCVTFLSDVAPLRSAKGRWSKDVRGVAERLLAAYMPSEIEQQTKMRHSNSMTSLLEIFRCDANLRAQALSYTKLIDQKLCASISW